jgi:apolipoprotein D and lipocalin family protein
MSPSLLIAAVLAVAAPSLPNAPVPALDLNRYVGQWHEIAHLPMFFQRKCVDRTTATYTLQNNGRIRVHNACRAKDGSMMSVVGEARRVAGGSPAALQVRFAPDWLGWLPMAWADYWVVEIDPDYRWAVVGGPSRKYLWILSREPTLDRALFEQIKAHAAQRGYPVEKLVLTAAIGGG